MNTPVEKISQTNGSLMGGHMNTALKKIPQKITHLYQGSNVHCSKENLTPKISSSGVSCTPQQRKFQNITDFIVGGDMQTPAKTISQHHRLLYRGLKCNSVQKISQFHRLIYWGSHVHSGKDNFSTPQTSFYGVSNTLH